MRGNRSWLSEGVDAAARDVDWEIVNRQIVFDLVFRIARVIQRCQSLQSDAMSAELNPPEYALSLDGSMPEATGEP